jgi:uncharacterized protein (TIGR02145 family)
LTTYIGGNVPTFAGTVYNVGVKLKEVGKCHWSSTSYLVTNETGFTALAGGYRDYTGLFAFIQNYGYWWSATGNINYLSSRTLLYLNGDIQWNFGNTSYGRSVRLIKD